MDKLEQLDQIETKAQLSVADTGIVEGIAWPFSGPDSVGDMIEPGAFIIPDALPICMEHDQKQVVGIWESFTETADGLEVKGRLFVEGIDPAKSAHRYIKAGLISGLSISFKNALFQRMPDGKRLFKSVPITEISICKNPVHPSARITAVKSHTVNSETVPMENANPAQEVETKTAANDAAQIDTKALNAVLSRLDKLEAKSNRPGAPAVVQGDTTEKKAFTNYLRGGEARMEATEIKALAVANNANGGYLVPPEFGSEILKLLTEMSPLRQYASVQTVTGSDITFPTLLSGVNAFWTDEGADMTASEPTFGQVKIANYELSSFYVASNKVLEDNAYDLEAVMNRELAEGFAKVEGLAFVKGTGTGQPRGLMTATGISEIKTGVAANFPASNPMDVLITMQHAIPSFHARSACWLMNRNTLATIRKFKDSTGQYLVTDPKDGGVLRLLGNPIVEMPDMDNVAAGTAPIMFGDLSGYRIFDRVDLSILRDPYTLGTKGQVRFIARKRVGADLTHADRFVKLRVAA